MGLSDKQKVVADEYIVTLDKTKSYLKYYKSVKKRETAYAAASRLFEKPAMKAYIEARMKELDEEMIAQQREVLRFLSAMMRGETKEAVLIGQGNGRQSIGDMEVSMKDRIRAGELLGKRYGLWTEKVDLDGGVAITFIEDVPLDD